jgi:hypothetical protein
MVGYARVTQWQVLAESRLSARAFITGLSGPSFRAAGGRSRYLLAQRSPNFAFYVFSEGEQNSHELRHVQWPSKWIVGDHEKQNATCVCYGRPPDILYYNRMCAPHRAPGRPWRKAT